jgi:hypothetical protein
VQGRAARQQGGSAGRRHTGARARTGQGKATAVAVLGHTV